MKFARIIKYGTNSSLYTVSTGLKYEYWTFKNIKMKDVCLQSDWWLE